ncbi:MAG: sensor histidine kinase, partial [Flavobacteriaceae bacterium]
TPLYSDNKKTVWALFVYHNITEQKEVQQELAKARETERELNELKSRFISMASHEFRTPLSAILSSAILIGKQNEPGKEDKRLRHVGRIRDNVKNLVVILNDFLSLSKLEEGKVRANPETIELIQFSRSLVEEMEASRKKGQVILLKSNEETVSAFLDPKLLNHILVNLLSNACKYSDEHTKIQLEIHSQDGRVIFTITDQGIGIPEEEHKNIFERFFRAKNVTNIQGTGLGLHIVRQYTRLMEGEVSFESHDGNGSTFKVNLPLNLSKNEENITD